MIVCWFGTTFPPRERLFFTEFLQSNSTRRFNLPGRKIKSTSKPDRSINQKNQDDPRLIQEIQAKYLIPPSNERYNLSLHDDNNPSKWLADYVHTILNGKRKGFFIECGAQDGEWMSNTLRFEKTLGWQGVLIEALPEYYRKMMTKHRKAWTVPACLSINTYSSLSMMTKVWTKQPGWIEKYSFWRVTNSTSQVKDMDSAFEVQCFPIYSILLALNRTKIDYFSLDVEGNELKVLKTIPWDKVEITVISAEFYYVKEGKRAMKEYMASKGYKVYADSGPVKPPHNADFVFYHPELLRQVWSRQDV